MVGMSTWQILVPLQQLLRLLLPLWYLEQSPKLRLLPNRCLCPLRSLLRLHRSMWLHLRQLLRQQRLFPALLLPQRLHQRPLPKDMIKCRWTMALE